MIFNELTKLFHETIAETLSAVSGRPWTAAVSDSSAVPEIHAAFHITGGASGKLALSLTTKDAKALAAVLLGTDSTTPIEAGLNPDETEAFAEASRQILGSAVNHLRAAFPDIKAVYVGASLDWIAARDSPIAASSGQDRIYVRLLLDQDLAAALSREPQLSEADLGPGEYGRDTKSDDCLVSTSKIIDQARNLPLLMDVDLSVSLRFGRRDVMLKDIMELRPGSVLELDREVTEPVDLLLNGKIVARGEVVIVAGNYGLRVTEVATPNERAQSIC